MIWTADRYRARDFLACGRRQSIRLHYHGRGEMAGCSGCGTVLVVEANSHIYLSLIARDSIRVMRRAARPAWAVSSVTFVSLATTPVRWMCERRPGPGPREGPCVCDPSRRVVGSGPGVLCAWARAPSANRTRSGAAGRPGGPVRRVVDVRSCRVARGVSAFSALVARCCSAGGPGPGRRRGRDI